MTTPPLFTDIENPFPAILGYHTEMTVDTGTDGAMDPDVKDFLTDANTLALPEKYVEFLRIFAFITCHDDFYMEGMDTSLVHITLTQFVERLGAILVRQHLTHGKILCLLVVQCTNVQ
jgi:hypothetical protein